jgi:hypothetical protein
MVQTVQAATTGDDESGGAAGDGKSGRGWKQHDSPSMAAAAHLAATWGGAGWPRRVHYHCLVEALVQRKVCINVSNGCLTKKLLSKVGIVNWSLVVALVQFQFRLIWQYANWDGFQIHFASVSEDSALVFIPCFAWYV